MWSKTTVLYVALVTLAVIGSIASVPLKEINVPTAAVTEKPDAGVAQKQEQSELFELSNVQDKENVDSTAANELSVEPSEASTAAVAAADAVKTETVEAPSDAVKTETVEAPSDAVKTETVEAPADAVKTETVKAPAEPVKTETVEAPTTGPFIMVSQKFDNNGGYGLVQVDPSVMGVPSFPDFIQAFQEFLPFPHMRQQPPFNLQPFGQPQQQLFGQPQQQPFGQPQQQPFGQPQQQPSLHQMVNAYEQSFKNMMTSMYDTMSQMEQHVPKTSPPAAEPIRKSMSKTEVINGHLVETNETVYSDGDDNFKSFYHFKKVMVVPEGNGNKKDNVESAEKSNAETMVKNKMNKNPSRQNDNNKSNLSQNNGEPIPLDDHFQMAAATYYAPSIPYGLSNPSPIFGLTDYNNRLHTLPPYYQAGGHVHYPSGYQISSANNNLGLPEHRPAPISLHNDIHVNELIAAQLQGTNAALPPDVELFKGKPPALRKGHHNHNDHHNRGQEKFPGRKN